MTKQVIKFLCCVWVCFYAPQHQSLGGEIYSETYYVISCRALLKRVYRILVAFTVVSGYSPSSYLSLNGYMFRYVELSSIGYLIRMCV